MFIKDGQNFRYDSTNINKQLSPKDAWLEIKNKGTDPFGSLVHTNVIAPFQLRNHRKKNDIKRMQM